MSYNNKQNKNAFALLVAIFLLTTFALLSIRVIENTTLSNNINKLKYFNIQANIYMAKVLKFAVSHTKQELLQLDTSAFLNNPAFELEIKQSTSKPKVVFVKIYHKDFANMDISITREIQK